MDDVGLFVAKGHVITCYQWDAIIDNQFGEYHVGLCILYFLNNISAIMTIWKWSLLQTILDGYPLKEIFISYNESNISDVDQEKIVGVKKK